MGPDSRPLRPSHLSEEIDVNFPTIHTLFRPYRQPPHRPPQVNHMAARSLQSKEAEEKAEKGCWRR